VAKTVTEEITEMIIRILCVWVGGRVGRCVVRSESEHIFLNDPEGKHVIHEIAEGISSYLHSRRYKKSPASF